MATLAEDLEKLLKGDDFHEQVRAYFVREGCLDVDQNSLRRSPGEGVSPMARGGWGGYPGPPGARGGGERAIVFPCNFKIFSFLLIFVKKKLCIQNDCIESLNFCIQFCFTNVHLFLSFFFVLLLVYMFHFSNCVYKHFCIHTCLYVYVYI